MSAREEILGRIRQANAKVTSKPGEYRDRWQYGQGVPVEDPVELFVERVRDYSATVVETTVDQLQQALTVAVAAVGATTLVVSEGIEHAWREALSQAGAQLIADDPPLDHYQLDAIDGVITAAGVGIADTGTIVLNHTADQGRRALTLVPDRHICVIRTDQVVGDVPQAIARMRPFVEQGQPLTFISGGSATSDIELQRVDGVHGPRTLYVILVK